MRLSNEQHDKLVANYEATMKAIREKQKLPDNLPVVKFTPAPGEEGIKAFYIVEYDKYTEAYYCVKECEQYNETVWLSVQDIAYTLMGQSPDPNFVPTESVFDIMDRKSDG